MSDELSFVKVFNEIIIKVAKCNLHNIVIIMIIIIVCKIYKVPFIICEKITARHAHTHTHTHMQ